MINEKKTALVTGGNRGIGLAIVNGLAELGFKVLLGSRDLSSGEEAASNIQGDVIPVKLDLSNRDNLGDQVQHVLSAGHSPDVLINNAGILEHGNLLEIDPSKLDQSMRVNFQAPLELIRLLVPGMIERNYGRIVNLSSGWGSFDEGLGGPPAYAMSKAALNALTVKLAQEVPESIKVNAMCPGWVRTRMGGDGASRSPEKGAETALWLANLSKTGPSGKFFRDKKEIKW